MVQWLGLGLIPGWRAKIPQASWWSQKKKKKFLRKKVGDVSLVIYITYVDIYVYMPIYVHTLIHIIHAEVHNTLIFTYIYTYTCIYMYIHTNIYHTHTHTHTHTHENNWCYLLFSVKVAFIFVLIEKHLGLSVVPLLLAFLILTTLFLLL